MFFTSPAHQQRFLQSMQEFGKLDTGTLDPEYAAALYILTADQATWTKASGYVNQLGIDIPALLDEEDVSGGDTVLVRLAGNLFNGRVHLDPLELLRLDEEQFLVALTAIQVRRNPSNMQ